MAMFVAVLALVVTVSAVILLAADADRSSSRNEVRRSEARSVANSALDELYTRIEAGAPDPDPDAWYTMGPNGRVDCDPDDTPNMCFQVAVDRVERAPTSLALLDTTTINAEVTVRHSCRGFGEPSSGWESTCRFSRFAQTLRERSFLQFMYYTEYSTLDPVLYPNDLIADAGFTGASAAARRTQMTAACANRTAALRDARCVNVALVAGDVIDGSMYTLDDRVYVCRSGGAGPVFAPGAIVHAWNNGSAGTQPLAAATGCVGGPGAAPAGSGTGTPEVRVLAPSGVDISQINATFAQIAGGYAAAGNVSIQLDGDSYRVNGGTAVPYDSIIAVNGNVTLSGNATRAVTVYATGDVTITGDVTVPSEADCGAPTGDAMVGVAAAGTNGVRIDQIAAGQRRCVQAVLLSYRGSIATVDWGTRRDYGPAGAPTLTVWGAFVARYQGVFGGYDSTAGRVDSGYAKDFNFDSRLAGGQLQPPYLLAAYTDGDGNSFDVAARWRRVNTTEAAISCDELATLRGVTGNC